MEGISLSQAVLENLAAHLEEVEEGKNKIFDQYFPEPSKDRYDFEDLYESYIKRLGDLVKNAQKSDEYGFEVPFVIIGSMVEVQDLASQEVLSYRIVNPSKNSIGYGDVSCLSPVGKSLLLKKPGDEIEVNAPGGLFHYRIVSVRLDDNVG